MTQQRLKSVLANPVLELVVDAAKYFDYVLGFTDKDLVDRVLRERSTGLDLGMQLSAERQPKRAARAVAETRHPDEVHTPKSAASDHTARMHHHLQTQKRLDQDLRPHARG